VTIALSCTMIALAWALLLAGVAPVTVWFYVLVWYPTLVLLDRLAARGGFRRPVLGRNYVTLSLFAWSPVIWLVFEAANLRLRNWYYVFLPANPIARWAGILLSFATVVPAIILAERLLASYGVARGVPRHAVVVTRRDLIGAEVLGAGMLALSLGWPRTFFPLVWGGVWLILEPWVLRRLPAQSLFGDLARGDWGRITRIMLGGLGIGVLWEFYNFWARGKWIYTVPWLEHSKVFEMPPLGFLGFPFFALEAWAMYHALVALGIAASPGETWGGVARSSSSPDGARLRSRRVLVAAAIAAVGSAAILYGMERRTISSVSPRVADLPTITAGDAARLREAGVTSPFALREADPRELGRASGLGPARVRRAVDAARLTTLRGIGATHAATLFGIGVRSVCALARTEPTTVLRRIDATTRVTASRRARPTLGEVRVWVGAAREACPASRDTP
jgi:hypothetical protein